jgi:hypothetical protein
MKFNATYTAGLGAAVMFLLDPDRGRRRRAWLRDKGIRACRKIERAYFTTRRDFRNRVVSNYLIPFEQQIEIPLDAGDGRVRTEDRRATLT